MAEDQGKKDVNEAAAPAAASPAPTTLGELRGKLDQVDEEIVRLIARRLETVGLILKDKAGRPQGIRDAERERAVLARVEGVAQSLGVSGPLARKIFSEIITHSLTRQAASLSSAGAAAGPREVAMAFQGTPLTFNHLAAQKYLAARGLVGKFVSSATIADAVEALETGGADLCFLPIENTVAGSINQVYEVLREGDLHIVGEETYKVDTCLAAPADVPLSALHQILSHPLALDQCSAFVHALGQARGVPVIDSAEAMRLVAEAKDPTMAAIGSPEAAEANGLVILRRTIGNQDEILMRYVALARAPEAFDPRIPCKVSLIITTRHEAGSLLRCLQTLSDYGLSLTKLESRPRPNRPWEYMFFVDFEGNVADPRVTAALDELRAQALYLKILGCYPARATPAEARATEVKRSAVAPADAAAAPPPPAKKAPPPPATRSKHYKLADRSTQNQDTVVRVGDLLIGGDGFTVMAGPCSVESSDQIYRTASFVREHGAHILRGGVFKPRTSPYAFQGMGYDGLSLLAAAGQSAGLPIITEVMAPEQVRQVAEKADILQIGARNMQNFSLLKEVGKVDRPVLLKRGLSSTIEEWLAAAEYILAQGNGQVILCERGIRTFESATRNTLDLSAVVVLRERTHLPVIVDPSHGTGKRAYVAPMAMAARACGAHGLLIEVHPDPDTALSDGDQSLTFPEFASLMEGLGRLRV
jgi:chorismate mutase / prephenate dehydratase